VTLLQWKKDPTIDVALPRLKHTHQLLQAADFTSPESVKAALWSYAEATGKGEVLWPLRVALTGRERSPDPFTVAYILGHTETLDRIDTACAKIEAHAHT
jgi:Glutamyl- and glutaminyl-tRNA synthetases